MNHFREKCALPGNFFQGASLKIKLAQSDGTRVKCWPEIFTEACYEDLLKGAFCKVVPWMLRLLGISHALRWHSPAIRRFRAGSKTALFLPNIGLFQRAIFTWGLPIIMFQIVSELCYCPRLFQYKLSSFHHLFISQVGPTLRGEILLPPNCQLSSLSFTGIRH